MKEPAFWRTDGGRGSGALARALLAPLGWIHAWAVARRIRKATPVRIGPKVVCVGNLTVGGTGKTPVTQTLMQRLAEMKLTAASLSRGYGGRETGPTTPPPSAMNRYCSPVPGRPGSPATAQPVVAPSRRQAVLIWC